MSRSGQTGVLLVNLGTPKTSKSKDVYHYLNEFLTDRRVIDIPWLPRQLLVRGLIVPMRFRSSAKSYQEIWTEQGSPLMIYSLATERLLRERLGSNYVVEIAMRYQQPSIEEGLERLRKADVEQIVVVPLYPQYASATTGTVHEKVMDLVRGWEVVPAMSFVQTFFEEPKMIQTFAEHIRASNQKEYDHVLFSFHGLPESQIRKADSNGICLSDAECCSRYSHQNKNCYSAQCYETARLIATELGLEESFYSICFQSRLGNAEWLKPYTSDMIKWLVQNDKKRVLVVCPSFVCDCLETLYEIGIEYRDEFLELGGEAFDLVPGLNQDPQWVEALVDIVKDHELQPVGRRA